jgi:hypothetical protein
MIREKPLPREERRNVMSDRIGFACLWLCLELPGIIGSVAIVTALYFLWTLPVL